MPAGRAGGEAVQVDAERLIDGHPVRHALLDAVAVPDRNIRVAIARGAVTLAGVVTSTEERAEAERIVEHVPGVRAVHNQLAVWPDDLESEVVRETVREALGGDRA